MRRHVRQVAVLGSGVMGGSIAAHFANAGIPALVLDIVPRELNDKERAGGLDPQDRRVRNRIAQDSVAALAKMRPAPLFAPWRRSLITAGNLEDDLPRLAEADWIIEVVKEDMQIKKAVLAGAARHMNEHAVLTSNTSGLSLSEMADSLPETVRSRFCGTHFFNPPRYMKLLELIPTAHTDAGVVAFLSDFARRRLGKGVVPAKDTPNFIANRIGVHSMMATVLAMREMELTIEEIDAITGPPMGRPKTATFRLADLVGLDTLLLVARTVYDVAADESRDVFVAPDFLVRMVDRGLLGRKTGAGFYKKVNKPETRILTLDTATLEYRDPRKPDLPELRSLRGVDDPAERIRLLMRSDGRAARAAWRMLGQTLSYSAMRLGEIADDAATIDRAMRLGFNWELGPFETWDALGFRPTVERMRQDELPLPTWVNALYDSGGASLYQDREGRPHTPTSTPGVVAAVADDPDAVDFERLRQREPRLPSNGSASLIDLGDDVLGLEFHSKMNAIDQDSIEMILEAADVAERDWQALVVANGGENFSAGANLMLLVEHAQRGNWKGIEKIIASFQRATHRLERCAVPVVTAPHGMALGGGCEVVLAGNAVHAAAEAYVGLVELGAGVIPAGGGCLRLYRRNTAGVTHPAELYPGLQKTFETIGMAKVSTSAEEARELGFLGPQDAWSMNRDHLAADAKQKALGLARSGYTPPSGAATLQVTGRGGIALIDAGLINMLEGRFISEHDRKVGLELARILCGGDVAGPTTVSEQHILDLEREAFLRLCGEKKTVARMVALLETGKPLRN